MQKRRVWEPVKSVFLAALLAFGGMQPAFGVSSSNNYQLDESEFNAGTMDSCSVAYCARASIGSTAVGESQSAGGTATFGPITPDEPSLDVIVDPGVSNLGILTSESTASKTMVVRIRNYLSNGYTLQITGDPPKYSNHFLDTPDSPTAAAPGTEQFALNATVNTTPAIGALPEQVPSGDFSFGTVEDDYDNPNQFKYSSGDVIARSTSQSGRTDYTISMIVNIASNTPAGRYQGDYSAVVIPVY